MTQTPVQVVISNIRTRRKARGWSQARLAEEMTARGAPLSRAAVAKLETGHRDDMTISEVFAAADALTTSPVDLLTPPEGGTVALLPYRRGETRDQARRWLTGEDRLHEVLDRLDDLRASLG